MRDNDIRGAFPSYREVLILVIRVECFNRRLLRCVFSYVHRNSLSLCFLIYILTKFRFSMLSFSITSLLFPCVEPHPQLNISISDSLHRSTYNNTSFNLSGTPHFHHHPLGRLLLTTRLLDQGVHHLGSVLGRNMLNHVIRCKDT